MNRQRIATVRRVRALQERIARSEVARRQHLLAEQQRAEADAWREVSARSEDRSGDVSCFRAHRRMLEGGAFDARRAHEAADEAGRALVLAVEAWQVEAQRRDGIERLAERVDAEHRAEIERLAANELDDLVVMRHRGADS